MPLSLGFDGRAYIAMENRGTETEPDIALYVSEGMTVGNIVGLTDVLQAWIGQVRSQIAAMEEPPVAAEPVTPAEAVTTMPDADECGIDWPGAVHRHHCVRPAGHETLLIKHRCFCGRQRETDA